MIAIGCMLLVYAVVFVLLLVFLLSLAGALS
jgi:hypothetical protein